MLDRGVVLRNIYATAITDINLDSLDICPKVVSKFERIYFKLTNKHVAEYAKARQSGMIVSQLLIKVQTNLFA